MAGHLLDAALPAPARGVFSTRSTGDQRQDSGKAALAAALGVPVSALRYGEQVHGAGVARAAAMGPGVAGRVPDVDALVSDVSGIVLVVLAADCMPVLFVDPRAGLVGAAHAGRAGLLAGVLQATLAELVAAGASPGQVTAVVGPCIGDCCYELPAEVVAQFERAVPGTAGCTRWGTASVNLRAGAEGVLRAEGIGGVRHVGGCTHDQPDQYYSHRRDATPGRHAGAVLLT